MKTVLKKIKIVSLVALIAVGSVIGGVSFHNTTNNQYILSSYSPKRNSIHSLQAQQSRSNITTVSIPNNTEASSNWAGYVVTPSSNSAYTSVSGSWIVPNISASKQNAVAAQWIGLGGVTSTDLLQMGTVEDVENGQPVAKVFWEKLPDVAQYVTSVPIGSTISVDITNSSDSTWNLTFTAKTPDGQTKNQTVSTTLDSSYAKGIGTSAEWISEDPSNENNQLVPLANMGTVKYESAMVNGQPLKASGNNVKPITMVSSNGNVLVYPSQIGADGKSFSTASASSTNSANLTKTTNLSVGRKTREFPKSIQKRNEKHNVWIIRR